MPRQTIHQRLVAGLEALGYQRVINTRVTRYVAFQRGEGHFWYVGRGGSLRIGHTVASAHPAGPATRAYVLTAPAVRPLVLAWLDRLSYAIPAGADASSLARDAIRTAPELADVEPRVVLGHVTRWLKERGL